jgi:catechol 2,3-dioxygenase-like lactoylglutathione lyase family enzyme
MRGLHHLDLNVTDLERSAVFYDCVLGHLGFTRIVDTATGEKGFDWIAPDSNESSYFSIGLFLAASAGKPHDRHTPGLHHLALHSENRDRVEGLNRILRKIGAEILDAPAEYPEYGPGYYAVFFLDPDGLKLECVFAPESA